MHLRLHANATTTPRIRAYIQSSTASAAELADELGISETTVRKWRGRSDTRDQSHRPHRIQTGISDLEERLICELRQSLWLSIDDIVEVMSRCVRTGFSRSAVHRCLQRNGLSERPKPKKDKPGVFDTDRPLGFVHCDVKYLPAIRKQKHYAFVAIDRATRFVHVEVLNNRSAAAARGFLERFLEAFPHEVHTVLTDNGPEFTDRFASDKKGKPHDKPSGNHPFDEVCAGNNIKHTLIKPYRPETNGMVERFNRRLSEHLATRPKHHARRNQRFHSTDDLTQFVETFVHAYNRTRLRCLNYQSPVEAMNNQPGQYI